MSDVKEQIVLRRWEESDFEDAVVLNREAEEGLGIPPETGDWAKDMQGIKEVFLDGGGEFLVGHLDGKLVVMGGFKIGNNKSAEVKRMRVSPSLHRQGIGSWFLSLLEDKMRERGIEYTDVSTLSAQQAALGLYNSMGYMQVGKKPGSGVEAATTIVSFKKKLR
jgi:ribosomal protein S18 acetylase RimI-like enzyme